MIHPLRQNSPLLRSFLPLQRSIVKTLRQFSEIYPPQDLFRVGTLRRQVYNVSQKIPDLAGVEEALRNIRIIKIIKSNKITGIIHHHRFTGMNQPEKGLLIEPRKHHLVWDKGISADPKN